LNFVAKPDFQLNGAYGQTQVITSDIQNLINSVVANLKASLQTLLAALKAALVGSVTNVRENIMQISTYKQFRRAS
jgi:hypothetical protein